MKKALLFLLMILLIVAPVMAWYDPIFYYRFNDNLLDSGPDGYDLTWSAGGAEYVSGTIGKAAKLVESEFDYIENNAVDGTNISKIRTIDFWYYSTSSISNQAILDISSGAASDSLSLRQDGSVDKIWIRLYKTDPIWLLDDTSQFSGGGWTHIVLTMGSGGAKLYVDGVLDDSDADTGVMTSVFDEIVVGSTNDGGHANFFDGYVDNLFATYVEYSQDNVTASYNAGVGIDFITGPTTTIITLESPDAYDLIGNASIVFQYTPAFVGGYDIDSCVLYINDTLNTIDSTVTNGTINSFEPVDIQPGNYSWLVGCNDTGVSILNSTPRYFEVGFFVDDCSVYTTRTINFTIRDDTTDDFVASDLTVYAELYTAIVNNTPFNLSYSGLSNYSICLIPDNTYYNVFAQMEYGGFGDYETKSYYLTDITLSNETQQIYLYLSANTTQLVFTITDENDDEIEDVYVNILKYDFGTNSHKTVEIVKSDESGQAIGNVILVTQWYKLILYKDGEVIYTTDPIKFLTNEYNVRVNLQEDYTEYYRELQDVYSLLEYNNETNNFVYTFSNPTGSSKTACLKVVQFTTLSDNVAGESCSSASSGTLLVNIGDPVNQSGKYIATGTVEGSPEIVLDSLIWEVTETTYRTFGQDAVFMTFFIRLTFALIGIWSPLVAIILLVGGDVLMGFLGFTRMSLDFVIVYVLLAILSIWRLSRRQ